MIKNIEKNENSLDKSIQIAKNLGNELIKLSKNNKSKYPFRMGYLDHLFQKWRINPGKYEIHINDLPDYFTIKFGEKGKRILLEIYNSLRLDGLDRLSRKYKLNLYLLHDFLIIKRSASLTVGFIKKLRYFLNMYKKFNFEIKDIEKEVISIRPHRRANCLKLKFGFPLIINNDDWAYLFGIIHDSYLKKFSFATNNKEFINKIIPRLKLIGLNTHLIKEENVYKTENQSIASNIISISGIDITKKQIISNNPLPLWMFSKTSDKFQHILLSKIYDTEGCAPNGNNLIRIAQANCHEISNKDREYILENCRNVIVNASKSKSKEIVFSKLNENLKEKILANPPLILVSCQLLLMKHQIYTSLYPLKLYISENKVVSSSWHLTIQNFTNLNRFNDLIGKYIMIDYKKERLNYEILGQKREILEFGSRKFFYLDNANRIQKDKGYFTVKSLISLSKKNKKTIYNTIGYLAQEKLINIVDIKGHTKCWKLTDKGYKIINRNNLYS